MSPEGVLQDAISTAVQPAIRTAGAFVSLDTTAEVTSPDVLALGTVVVVAVLTVLFVLEGLVVGKVVQPSILFVGYLTVADLGWWEMLLVGAVCGAGSTAGQWALYTGFDADAPELLGIRRVVPCLTRLPVFVEGKVGERWLSIVDRQVDRFGWPAIVVATALPVVRTGAPIVAGVSSYPHRRYLIAATVGNALHVGVLLAAVWGVAGVGRLVGLG